MYHPVSNNSASISGRPSSNSPDECYFENSRKQSPTFLCFILPNFVLNFHETLTFIQNPHFDVQSDNSVFIFACFYSLPLPLEETCWSGGCGWGSLIGGSCNHPLVSKDCERVKHLSPLFHTQCRMGSVALPLVGMESNKADQKERDSVFSPFQADGSPSPPPSTAGVISPTSSQTPGRANWQHISLGRSDQTKRNPLWRAALVILWPQCLEITKQIKWRNKDEVIWGLATRWGPQTSASQTMYIESKFVFLNP